eukprot:scaffold393375_cov83-Attheya_sp.AAC.1
MIIGQWRRDEVGVLSVSAEVGAVSANESLVHPASTVGHPWYLTNVGMWSRLVLAMTQQVERRAWLPMVMISSAVLNKEEEERLESGCWADN